MTNKKHIETLRFKTDASHTCPESLAAAIRALKFEDAAKADGESATLEHVRAKLNTFATTKEAAEYVLAESVLARAEGYTKGWNTAVQAYRDDKLNVNDGTSVIPPTATVEAKYARLVRSAKAANEEGSFPALAAALDALEK